jgi:hypothetical protein
LELALMARGESTIRELESIVDHVLGAEKAVEEKRHTKTPCCGYEWDMMKDSGPIFWNPYNSVVQCHNCGSAFVSIPQAENAGAQFNQRLDSEFEKRLREKATWDGLQGGLSGAGDGSLATLGGDSKAAALGQQRAPVETNDLSRYEGGFRRVGYGPAHDLPGGDVLAYVTIPEMYAESLLGEAATQGKSATVFLDETFQNALEGYFSTLRT